MGKTYGQFLEFLPDLPKAISAQSKEEMTQTLNEFEYRDLPEILEDQVEIG